MVKSRYVAAFRRTENVLLNEMDAFIKVLCIRFIELNSRPLEIPDHRFKIDLNTLATALCCLRLLSIMIVNFCAVPKLYASCVTKIVHKLIEIYVVPVD